MNEPNQSYKQEMESTTQVLQRRYKFLRISSHNTYINSFIEPSLKVSKTFTNETSKKQPITIQQIFKCSNNDGERIVVVGQPGFGKTNLLYKLAKDWANREVYLNGFSLVFLISLKHLKHSIERELDDQFEQKISHLLEKFQRKILLMLDGYEELNQKLEDKVLPLLCKEKYPNMTVIVTSRIESKIIHDINKSPYHKPTINVWDKWVHVKGLMEDDKNRFIKQYLGEDIKEFQALTSSHFNDIKDLTKNPLYFFSLASLVKQQRSSEIRTKTDLIKRLSKLVIERNLQRKQCKMNDEGEDGAPFYKKLLQKFGKFYINHKESCYKREEILKACQNDERVFALGILRKIVILKNHSLDEKFKPVHKLVAQFCAARYLKALNKKNKTKFKKIILSIFESDSSHVIQSMIFPFLVDLSGNEAHELIKLIYDCEIKFKPCNSNQDGDGGFCPIINILNECEVNNRTFDWIQSHVPENWRIQYRNRFYTSHIRTSQLEYKIRKKRIISITGNIDLPSKEILMNFLGTNTHKTWSSIRKYPGVLLNSINRHLSQFMSIYNM